MTDVKLTTKLEGIKQVETGLGRLDKQIGTLSKSVTKFGQGMVKVGKELTTKVTLPIIAMGGAVLKVAGDFEAGMNRVRALTGATTDQLADMEKQARELGATTQFSASQAADAMGFMAQAGLKANDIMGSLPHTLNLAAAAQIDMGRAADITTNIMAGFRLGVDDMGHAVDVLTATFTNSNTDILQMSEAMKFVGPIASGFKVSMEETAAAVGLLGNAGIQGSLAGTTLRNVLIRLADPADESAKLLEKLGINAMTSTGQFVGFIDLIRQMEKAGANTTEILKIFAARAGPGMEVLLSQGSEALAKFTEKLENSGGTAERIAKIQMEGFNGAMLALVSAFQELTIAIAASGLLEWATAFAKDMADMVRWLSKLNPEILKWGTIIAGVASLIGPLLIVLGGLSIAFGKLLPIGITVIAKVFKPMKLLILGILKPITLWTAAIIAVIGAVALLIAQWKNFKIIAIGVINKIGALWDKFLVLFVNGISSIVDAINVFGIFDNTVAGLENTVQELFQTWQDSSAAAGQSTENAMAAADRIMNETIDSLRDAKDHTIRFLDELLLVPDAMKNVKIATDDMSGSIDILGFKVQEVKPKVIVLTEDMKDAFRGVGLTTENTWDRMERRFDDGIRGATEGIRGYIAANADIAANTEAAMGRVLGGLEDALTQFFLTGKLSFKDFVDIVRVELARLAAKDLIAGIAGQFPSFGGSGGGSFFGSIIGGVRRLFGFAGGGEVAGPGGPKDDSILAFLSNGEYVINADAAGKLGSERLNVLNQGRVPGFADGGGGGSSSTGGFTPGGWQSAGSVFGQGTGNLSGGFQFGGESMSYSPFGKPYTNQGWFADLARAIFPDPNATMSLGQIAKMAAGIVSGSLAGIVGLFGGMIAHDTRSPVEVMADNLATAALDPGATGFDALPVASGNGRGRIPNLTGNLGSAALKLISDSDAAFASMATGGDRVFTRPTLLSVAENGPEHVSGRPMGSGGRGGRGINVNIEGDAVFDDITADDFARRVVERIDNLQVRGIA